MTTKTNQTTFRVNHQLHRITGLNNNQNRKIQSITKKKDRQCKWCGKTYTPYHNFNYCNKCIPYTIKQVTTFRVNHQLHRITGLNNNQNKPIKIFKKYLLKDRQCKWCKHEFTPKTPAQKYCNEKCSKYSTQYHTMNRVRRYRKKYKEILKERITNTMIGTGGLGGHACTDFHEELNKIRKEMRDIGISPILSPY